MKQHNRGSALLVELIIVTLFFTLAASVLIEMFTAAYTKSRDVTLRTQALTQAQNLAERLYAATSPEETLREEGFAEAEGVWLLSTEGLTFRVSGDDAGDFRHYTVEALEGETPVITLPVGRFLQGVTRP